MYIAQSRISCGIYELIDVRHNSAKIVRDYINDDFGLPPIVAILVASLTTKQKAGARALKANGFKAIGKPIRNPNSGNDIILFVKRFEDKKTKRKAKR